MSSYSIIRIEKIKAGGITGIQIHDRREKEGISHTNHDIDWNRTKENVDLLHQRRRFRNVVADRIAGLSLPRKPRKDATVMCQFLVTSDLDFFKAMSRQEQTAYFQKSLDFIRKRYGQNNLVSACIHYDEQTPHMHVNFVPITEDGRLSARDLFSPKSLRKLQDDYNRYVREQGYDLERGDPESRRKHLDVEAYKAATRYEELKEKKKELEHLEQLDLELDLKAEKGRFSYPAKEVEAIREQNKALKLELSRKKEQIRSLESGLARLENTATGLQKQLKGTELPMNRLKDLESESRALQAYLNQYPELKKQFADYSSLKESAYQSGQDMAAFLNRYRELQEKRKQGIQTGYLLEKDIQGTDAAISSLKQYRQSLFSIQNDCRQKQAELEQAAGFRKRKLRQSLQEQMEEIQKTFRNQSQHLKKEHGMTPDGIPEQIQALEQKKTRMQTEKDRLNQQTDLLEQDMQTVINEYKYLKNLTDLRLARFPDLHDLAERHSGLETFSAHEQRAFYIIGEDRIWIQKRMEQEHPSCLEWCRKFWSIQDRIRHEMKQQKELSHSQELER